MWGLGGEGGIRTHGRLAPTPVFKTGALNHSATSPERDSIAQRTHPLQALRAHNDLPQESLKISMRCLPPEKSAVGQNRERGYFNQCRLGVGPDAVQTAGMTGKS